MEKLSSAKDGSISLFEEIAIDISAKVANILMDFDLKKYTEDERINYLFTYSTELLLEIYSSLIIEKNTSINENNLFPSLLSYLDKMTPPNHRGLIDWTNIVMNRCKLYRQMTSYDNNTYGQYFTKLCQHELDNGTIYTYESLKNIPMTSYDDKFNHFYETISKTNIMYDIKNRLKNYL